jgi:hypothetical protein
LLDVQSPEIGVGLLLLRGLHLEELRPAEHGEDLPRQQGLRGAGAALQQHVLAHEEGYEDLVDHLLAVDDLTVDEGDGRPQTLQRLAKMKCLRILHGDLAVTVPGGKK